MSSDPHARHTAARPFQVDLRGVVDLLSRHIYSSPHVFVRELLQNGRDAVAARALVDPAAPAGQLRIEPTRDGAPFRFHDNGVGLTLDEAGELLSTVGRSSKRDEVLALRREEFLGQFGIGMLSCFMVADRIVVRSRSARGGAAIEWVGEAAGTFALRELTAAEADDVPVGTTVELVPRPDDASLLAPDTVTTLAARYGEYLPLNVAIADGTGGWNTVTRPAAFLERDETALRDLGREWLDADPLDVIPLDVPGTGTRGVAFVLPFVPPPASRQSHRVYLGRMLMGEHAGDLLPEWAFFVRCVFDTTGLTPTASREQLIDDSAVEFTRERIGELLRRWILRMATTEPHRFAHFLAVHHLALKAVALHDDELARVLIPELPVETSAGATTIGALLRAGFPIRYTATVDEFRQIAPIADAAAPLVNAGFTYETELLQRLALIDDVEVRRVTVGEVLDELAPPPLADRAASSRLERRASESLADAGVEVSARSFAPAELPGLSVLDPEVIRRIDRERTIESATPVWAKLLGDVDAILAERRESAQRRATARLCLNWTNPLVRRLADLDDAVVFDRTIRLLHVQSLLAAHRPLAAAERTMLTSALDDIVQLSAFQTSAPLTPPPASDPEGPKL
jgi:molecular chaperone HtpG